MSRRTSPAPVLPRPVSVAEAVAAADLLDGQAAAAGRLPAQVRALVRDITDRARWLLPRLAGGTGSRDVHLVIAVVTDYLPTALAHFVRLPAQWAAEEEVAPGRTSLDVLVGQLTVLADGLAVLAEQVCRADAAALLAHEAFLADRFDGSVQSFSLALPVFGPVVGQPPAAPAVPVAVEPRVPRPRRPGDAPRVAVTVLAAAAVAVACALPSSLTAASLDPHAAPTVQASAQASAAAVDGGPGLVGPVVADGGAR